MTIDLELLSYIPKLDLKKQQGINKGIIGPPIKEAKKIT